MYSFFLFFLSFRTLLFNLFLKDFLIKFFSCFNLLIFCSITIFCWTNQIHGRLRSFRWKRAWFALYSRTSSSLLHLRFRWWFWRSVFQIILVFSAYSIVPLILLRISVERREIWVKIVVNTHRFHYFVKITTENKKRKILDVLDFWFEFEIFEQR